MNREKHGLNIMCPLLEVSPIYDVHNIILCDAFQGFYARTIS